MRKKGENGRSKTTENGKANEVITQKEESNRIKY